MTQATNKKIPKILVGFSVNPEIAIEYSSKSKEMKIPLTGIGYRLGGSGYNVAEVLRKLGCSAHFFGLCGSNAEDPSYQLLQLMLDKTNISRTLFLGLKKQSIAVLPIDGEVSKVIGRRGKLQPDAIENVTRILQRNFAQIPAKIAVGVTSDELPLAETMFNSGDVNVFTPNMRLLDDVEVSNDQLDLVLDKTTILAMSDYEYSALLQRDDYRYLFSRLHVDFGIRVIIVTKNSHGGTISVDGNQFDYQSYTEGKDFVSEVGAGDWFLASFMAKFLRNKFAQKFDFAEIENCAKFAAMVAGLKTGYPGAINGPSPEEIQNHWKAFQEQTEFVF